MRIQNTLKLVLISLMFSFVAHAATISRVTTWADGQILTASSLNTEFNTVFNAVNALDNTNIIAGANIEASKLDPAIADDGLGLTGSSNLKVNTDGVGIETNSDAIRLKDLGVVTAKINDQAVTTAKLGLLAVTAATIADNTITHGKMATRNLSAGTGVDPGLGGAAISATFSHTWAGGTGATNSASTITLTAENRYVVLIASGRVHGCGSITFVRTGGVGSTFLYNQVVSFGSNFALTVDTSTSVNVPFTAVAVVRAQTGASSYAIQYQSLAPCAVTTGNVAGSIVAVEL